MMAKKIEPKNPPPVPVCAPVAFSLKLTRNVALGNGTREKGNPVGTAPALDPSHFDPDRIEPVEVTDEQKKAGYRTLDAREFAMATDERNAHLLEATPIYESEDK